MLYVHPLIHRCKIYCCFEVSCYCDPKMNPYSNGLPDAVQEKLPKRYHDIFNLFVKHSDKINRVTFWGVMDKHSWLNDWPIKGRTNYPLLFDRDYQPKVAYARLLGDNTKQ